MSALVTLGAAFAGVVVGILFGGAITFIILRTERATRRDGEVWRPPATEATRTGGGRT